MAGPPTLALRRQLNRLCRLNLPRAYATETTKPTPTPEEATRFLQTQDQAALRDFQQKLDTLTDHVKKISEHLSTQPTALPGITISDPSKHHANTSTNTNTHKRKTHITPIPTYTLSHTRTQTHLAHTLADKVLAQIEHVSKHNDDLLAQPYAKPSNIAGLDEWTRDVAAMTEGEMEDEYRSLLLEEETQVKRGERDSVALLELVKQIEAMGRKGLGVEDLEREGKVRNPFRKSDGGGGGGDGGESVKGRASIATGDGATEGGGEGAKGHGRAVTSDEGLRSEVKIAKPAPSNTLMEMQRRLEEELKKSKKPG
ncbi:hypothetical protein BAUCODRAFT_270423 [Baudoinia panamericana UAMH 10762]|uniref:Uncharacterized protein n=1 Tax=Baudoinia panamericana (strain UAMH 10762) TaxID=717646 RepID=M2MNJ4_BAUPA|nr:uncharacterized protein BAUCODRAFT_270423 [Baudoinia panamericana UAMH 10762]EMC93013.1 hypothetical protein BAUCODRAFT_270423 [Baudoinia panamericana UAMH 10762]